MKNKTLASFRLSPAACLLAGMLPLLPLLAGASPSPLPPPPALSATAAAAEPLPPDVDRSLDRLARDIDEQLAASKRPRLQRIAVLDFANLHGQISGLGQLVAEELITRLFRTRHYEIPDRYYLRGVVEQYKLSQNGLTRPATIKEFGRLLGAQVVLFGTVSDLGSVIKVNARLYRTDRGFLAGVAATQLPSTPGLVRLLKQVDSQIQVKPSPRRPSPTPTASGISQSAPPDVYWATAARASSEYSTDGWSAKSATGPPDTPVCGDFATAWATQAPNGGHEWLEITFDRKVAARSIRIVESFNPGAVVKVEALTAKSADLMWQGIDTTTQCPGELVIKPAEPVPLDRLRITLDTGKVAGWNEIDAVGIVGEKAS